MRDCSVGQLPGRQDANSPGPHRQPGRCSPPAAPPRSSNSVVHRRKYRNSARPDTQIGWVSPGLAGFPYFPLGLIPSRCYNLEAPGATAISSPASASSRSSSRSSSTSASIPQRGYSITATSVNAPEPISIVGVYTHFWGEPTDASHDNERFNWAKRLSCGGTCGAASQRLASDAVDVQPDELRAEGSLDPDDQL